MNYEETKKAYKQIEEWRKEISEKELKHINNVTDKNILLYLARQQVGKLNIDDIMVCDCTHTQACKICGEEKGLDGDFWKLLKG